MPKITDLVDDMKRNPKGIRFQDLCKVCDHYLGKRVRVGAVIESTKLRGKATRVSTSKMTKVRQRFIK